MCAWGGPVSWLHNSKSLGPLQIQNLKASNEIAKQRLLEYCGSERIYILPCESSSFTILWLSLCLVLSGPFATAGNPYIYVLYCTSSHCWAIHFWKQDSQSRRRTSKHRWRACRSSTLYSVSTSNRWYSKYNFSGIALPCELRYYNEIHFSITGLQRFR